MLVRVKVGIFGMVVLTDTTGHKMDKQMENDGACWGRLAPSGAARHSNRLVFTPFSSGCAPRSRSSLEPTCVIKSNAISQKLCQSAACGGGGAAERGGNNSLSRYGFVRNRQPAATPGEGLKECPRGVLSLPFAGCGYCRVLLLICVYLTLCRQRGIRFAFSDRPCEVRGRGSAALEPTRVCL